MWQSSPPGFFYSVALCPRHRFPIKSFALLACVSPCKIHLRVLDKSPHSGPRRSPSSAMNLEIFFIPLSSLKSNTSFFLVTGERLSVTFVSSAHRFVHVGLSPELQSQLPVGRNPVCLVYMYPSHPAWVPLMTIKGRYFSSGRKQGIHKEIKKSFLIAKVQR